MALREITFCGGGAFWGDSLYLPLKYLNSLSSSKSVSPNYFIYDFLAETTMGILKKVQKHNPELGYTTDFITLIENTSFNFNDTKIITNAGGLNPKACKEALDKVLKKKGIHKKIAYVYGQEANGYGLDTYISSKGIVEALNQGAEIVITSRVPDSALTLGPCIFEFKWSYEDYDLLSSGSLLGHLLECGTQATGGNFSDWENLNHLSDIGLPLGSINRNGRIKLQSSNQNPIQALPVKEQMVYEVSDPSNYILPDVNCDWTQVRLNEHHEFVEITGARGKAPTENLKAWEVNFDKEEFILNGYLIFEGKNSIKKYMVAKDTITQRCNSFYPAKELKWQEEFIHDDSKEFEKLFVKFKVSGTKDSLEFISKEIPSISTSLAPGLVSLLGGRPRVAGRIQNQLKLISRKNVMIKVAVDNKENTYQHPEIKTINQIESTVLYKEDRVATLSPQIENLIALQEIAVCRSGDKGNDVNIGVIFRNETLYEKYKNFLTQSLIKDFFIDEFDEESKGIVLKYDWPGINALNFVLKNCLDGGPLVSKKIDPQGKAFGQRLLTLKVPQI